MTTELNPMTNEEIEEELRQLDIEDGDETIEHADTQYSDYPEVDSSIQSIRVKYSDDAMWGSNGWDGYDVRASYAKFEKMVTEKLTQLYPGVEIEFIEGIDDRHETWNPETGWEASEDIAWAIHPIWESFDWAVENAN